MQTIYKIIVKQNPKSGIYFCFNEKYPNIPLYMSNDKETALEKCEKFNKGVNNVLCA